ncbi:MAG: 50S ribosomal protein L25 [Bacillota bacterium]|jgi:large subunit ribosomal protein L25
MTTVLNVSLRDGKARQLRRQGVVPGVVYGANMEPVSIQIDARTLSAVIRDSTSSVMKLVIAGRSGEVLNVIRKDVQLDPVTRAIQHFDLQVVDMTEKINATVPVVLVGDPAGVREGGLLQSGLRELNISALPGDLPQAIEVDTSQLNIGDQLTVADLVLPAGVEALNDPAEQVCSVVVVRAAEDEGEEEAAEAGEPEATEPEPEA